jgi:hypothetical protein
MKKLIFLVCLAHYFNAYAQVTPVYDESKEGYQYIDTILDIVVSKYYYDQAGQYKDGMARVSRKSLWGFIDLTGKEVIPCRYANAVEFDNGIAAVSIGKLNITESFQYIEDEKFALIDKKGNYQSEFLFAEVFPFKNGLARALDLSMRTWGWLDTKGNWKIEPKFNEIVSDFDEAGMAIVSEKNGNWGGSNGVINQMGIYIIPPEYISISPFVNNLTLVSKYEGESYKRKSGYFNRKGKVVIPIIYDEAESFSNGVALVGRLNDFNQMEFSYLDAYGKEKFPYKYEFAYSFKESITFVREKGRYKLINLNGEELYGRSFDIVENFNDLPYARVSNGGFWGAIDKNGIDIVPIIYDSIGKNANGFICLKNDKRSYINFKGEITKVENQKQFDIPFSALNYWDLITTDLLSANNMKIYNYNEYYTRDSSAYCKILKLNNKYAIFDNDGRQLTPFDYEEIYIKDYYVNTFIAIKNKFVHFIKYSESDRMISLKPTKITNIKIIENYDIHRTPSIISKYYTVMQNAKWGVVSKNSFEFVIDPIYDDIGFLPDESSFLIPVKRDSKWGFIDTKTSNLVIPFKYDSVGFYLYQNLWQVKINGSWRIIGETGNFISDLFFDDAVNFVQDKKYCGIKVGDKWGYINKNLNWVIKPIFQKIGIYYCDYECHIALLNKMLIKIDEYGSWNNYFPPEPIGRL